MDTFRRLYNWIVVGCGSFMFEVEPARNVGILACWKREESKKRRVGSEGEERCGLIEVHVQSSLEVYYLCLHPSTSVSLT